MPGQYRVECKTKLMHILKTNFLSDSFSYVADNSSIKKVYGNFFLHCVVGCLSSYKNGTLTGVVKCNIYDFDQMYGYILCFAEYML